MDTKLPFFKFVPDTWLTGAIMTCSREAQGVFATLCAHYWNRSCQMSFAEVNDFFENDAEELEELMEKDIVLVGKSGMVAIKFLDEQLSAFEPTKMVRTKWKGSCDVPSYGGDSVQRGKKEEKEIDKEYLKEKLKKRKRRFINQVNELTEFPESMREAFIDYWTELNPSGTKMRKELQPTFEIKRRLGTWQRNEKKFGSNQSTRFGPNSGHTFSGHKFKSK